MNVTVVLLVGFMTLLVFVFVANARRTNRKFLPPGPPSLPLIGHLLVLPSQSNMLQKVQAWSRVYGEWKGVFLMGRAQLTLCVFQGMCCVCLLWAKPP